MTSITKVYTADEFRVLITTKPAWAERAIVRLFEEQTPTEQELEATAFHNGRGFTATDAEWLTSFAKQIIRMGDRVRRDNGHRLSDKQLAIAYKKLWKYGPQLHRLAYPKVENMSVEASELGIRPGEMVTALTYEGKVWNFDSLKMEGEDLAYWLFKSVDGAKLTVFND